MRRPNGDATGGSRGTDAGQHLIALGMAELDCRLLAIVQGLQVRALLECELQKLIGVGRRSAQWSIVLYQVVCYLPIKTQHRIQCRHRRVDIVLRIEQ